MSNSIAPGSSADVNVKVTALTTNPNVPVTYKTIILKKNLVNGVNTLTQEMMSAINTKYVIKYDYVLGENINVPDNCILEFDGGSISANGSNDTITGANTSIQAELVKIFNTNLTITGTWNIAEAYPEWFGAKGDGVTDDFSSLQKCFDTCIKVKCSAFLLGKYYTSSTLNIKNVRIIGVKKPIASLNYYVSKKYGDIGYDFMKNANNGALVTFAEMVDEAVEGTCIVSDVANPILTCIDDGIDVENFGIVGWIRNRNQKGVLVSYNSSKSYIGGNNRFKNFVAAGFGSNGIEIPSLECQELVGVETYCNNGYGFAIIGHSSDTSIDTPFEYCLFDNCKFNYNKKEGFYSNVFRKDVTFHNCQVQMPGQYDYETVSIPNGIEDVIAGIKIEGVCPTYSGNRVGEGLIFDNIWGELCQKAIHVTNIDGTAAIRNLHIINCSTTYITSDRPHSLYYVKVPYLYGFEVEGNNGNNSDIGYIESLIEGSNFKGNSLYNTVQDKTPFEIKTNKIYADSYYKELSQNQSDVVANITTDYVLSIFKDYYPGANTSYKNIVLVVGFNYKFGYNPRVCIKFL